MTANWKPSTWSNAKDKPGADPTCEPNFVNGRLDKCQAFTKNIHPYEVNKCSSGPPLPPGSYPSFYNGSYGSGLNCKNDTYLDDQTTFSHQAKRWGDVGSVFIEIPPDPNDPKTTVKAKMSVGHGLFEGECGSITLIRYCNHGYGNCSKDGYKYLLNFQTDIRSVSFETSASDYLDNNPYIDHTTVCTLFDAIEMTWDEVSKYFPK